MGGTRAARSVVGTPFTDWLDRQIFENRLSAEELTRHLGLKASSTVSNWRRGSSVPNAGNIIALGREFRTDTDYILRLIARVPTDSTEADERRQRLARLTMEVDDSDLETAEKLLRVYVEKKGR